jgi:hypothetical protein
METNESKLDSCVVGMSDWKRRYQITDTLRRDDKKNVEL